MIKNLLKFLFFTIFLVEISFAAPNINILDPSSNGQYFSSSIQLLNLTTDINSNCTYNINLGANSSLTGANSTSHYTTNIDITSYSDVLNNITIYCVNSLNSTDSNSALRTFYRDSVKPSTTDNNPSGWQTNTFSITLSPQDNDSGVSHTTYRKNFGPWTNGTSISISSSGVFAIDYYATDNAGNIETTNSIAALLDLIDPSTTDDAPSTWQTSNFNITLNATDAHSGIDFTSYRLNAGTWINSSTILINQSGNHTLEYFSQDIATNTETTIQKYVLLDKIAPNTTDNAPSGWQTTTYNITLTPTDNISGINYTSYRLNSGSWTNSTTINISNSGTYLVEYFSQDTATNTETTKNKTVYLDTEFPTTANTAPTGWQKTPFNVLLTSSDTISGVVFTSYRINNASWINGTLINIATAGNYTINFFAQDLAGNTENTKTVKVALDNIKPTTTDDIQSGWQKSTQNITLNATDNLSGISYTTYRINSGNWTNSSTIQINTSGNYTIEYYSVDNIGNIETTNSNTQLIDNIAPSTSHNSPLTWQSTPFVITLTPTDNLSGLNQTFYRLNGGNWTNGTIISITASDLGNNTLEFYSTDNANNTETIVTIHPLLDMQKPTTTDNIQSGWQKSSANITLNATDDASGVLYTNYRIDAGSWQNGTNILINQSGNYTIEYYSVDKKGNIETLNTKNALIDLEKPTTTDNAPSSWQTVAFNITLNATDNRSGINYTTYRLNGGNWTNSTLIQINQSGNNTIEYYSVDNAQNIENTTTIYAILDYFAPNTSNNAPSGWQTSNFNITLNATDDASGINQTFYRINNNTWINNTLIQINTSGNYTIEYYSTDKSGKTENTTTINVLLDTQKPTISQTNLISPVEYSLNKSYTFNITVSENIAILNASLIFDNTYYNLTNSSNEYYVTLSNLSLGTYNYSFIVYDLAENKANTTNKTFKIISLDSQSQIANETTLTLKVNTTKIIIPQNLPSITMTVNSSTNQYTKISLNFSNFQGNNSINITNPITISRNSNSLTIQANTTIKTISNWNKSFDIPRKSNLTYTIASGTANSIIRLGSDNFQINFSKPVKIVLSSMSGKKAAYAFNSTTLTAISTVCNSLTNPTNIDNTTTRQCYINDGSNLAIWTYHLTDFAAYTPTTTNNNNNNNNDDSSSSSSSSKKSSSSSTTTTTTTPVSTDDEEEEEETVKTLVWPRIENKILSSDSKFFDFKYLGKTNYLKLQNIDYNEKQIRVSLKGETDSITLEEEVQKTIDSDGDGLDDMKVWFTFSDSENVKIFITALDSIEVELTSTQEETNTTTDTVLEQVGGGDNIDGLIQARNSKLAEKPQDTQEEQSSKLNLSWWEILVLIILLAMILYIVIGYFRWRKYLKEEKLKAMNNQNNPDGLKDYVEKRKQMGEDTQDKQEDPSEETKEVEEKQEVKEESSNENNQKDNENKIQ